MKTNRFLWLFPGAVWVPDVFSMIPRRFNDRLSVMVPGWRFQ